MTTADLAARFGFSDKFIQVIERGERRLPMKYLHKMAAVLSVSPLQLSKELELWKAMKPDLSNPEAIQATNNEPTNQVKASNPTNGIRIPHISVAIIAKHFTALILLLHFLLLTYKQRPTPQPIL